MLANWIRMSFTDTGTGNVTPSSVTGYPGVTSQLATNERATYVILDSSELPIERGIGYYNGSAWVREKPMATYVSGTYTGANPSAASLAAGTKYLIISPGAQTVMTATQGAWANGYKGYGDVHTAAAPGSLTVTANRAYIIPFAAGVDSDIDAVLFNVGTAVSGNAVAAIYTVGADGLPGVQLAISSSVSIGTTGVKVCTFTRFRPPPRFFVGLLCDSASTLTSLVNMVCTHTMGVAASAVNPTPYVYQDGATSLTFPTSWTPTAAASNTARPLLIVRCP